MTLLLTVHGLVPAALLLWLGLGRAPGRAAWMARLALTAGYLVTVASAGLWLALPRSVLWGLVALLPVAAIAGWRRTRAGRWPASVWGRARLAATGVVALLVTGAATVAVAGRRPPEQAAVELRFPLDGPRYYVANGGSHPLLNVHLGLREPALRRYGGIVHGIDLVAVDRLGRRAEGLRPADPHRYAIFGDTVRAPCPGRVMRVVDGLPDLEPPQVDRSELAGNHVLLACEGDGPEDGVWVLLAHFRQGSLRVEPGQPVAAGDPLGVVGNSGNSDEPHLHIHAQRPGTTDRPLAGGAIPIRFDGRYLARNDRIGPG